MPRTAHQKPAVLRSEDFQTRLRAGVPQPVVTEIGSRRGIIGTIGLHAVGDSVIPCGSRGNRHHRAIIVILVAVIARRVVARPAVIGIAVCRERAADQCTGHDAREEAAVVIVVTVVIVAAAISTTIGAAVKLRDRRSAHARRAHAGTASIKMRDRSADAAGMDGGTTAAKMCGRRATAPRNAMLLLGEARRRQNHRHDGSGTQYPKLDHCWLHPGTLTLAPLTFGASGRSRAVRAILREITLSKRNCTRNERNRRIPRHSVTRLAGQFGSPMASRPQSISQPGQAP